MEASGHLHVPAALPPGKEPVVPIGWEAGRAPEPVWTRWCLPGLEPPIIQPVAQRYTTELFNYSLVTRIWAAWPGFDSRQRHRVQAGSGAHQWVPGALSPGVKRLGCGADNSPSSRAEVKNAWSYAFTSLSTGTILPLLRFEVFTAVNIQVENLWVTTSCNVHPDFTLKKEVSGRWYPSAVLHGVNTQKAFTWILPLVLHTVTLGIPKFFY
jgi:hypothetical protein